MGYHIDLSKITLKAYIGKLKNGYLPPSRKLLLDNIENKFQLVKNQGVENIEELRTALKTKKKLEYFSKNSGISIEYLTILNREINSSLPKPNKIKDFPGFPLEIAEKLEAHGIKHTLHLYNRIRNANARNQFKKETGLEESVILRLTMLTDISRVRWVNHTFAIMLFETGYQTLEKFASANAEQMHKEIKELNMERKFFKGNIGLNDIRICIDAAKAVPGDIEY